MMLVPPVGPSRISPAHSSTRRKLCAVAVVAALLAGCGGGAGSLTPSSNASTTTTGSAAGNPGGGSAAAGATNDVSVTNLVVTQTSAPTGFTQYSVVNPNGFPVEFFWGLTNCLGVFEPTPLCNQSTYPQSATIAPNSSLPTGIVVEAQHAGVGNYVTPFSFTLQDRAYTTTSEFTGSNPPPFP